MRDPYFTCRKSDGKLAGDPHEKRLERQLGRQVELLELPPRVADSLGSALGARYPVAARVLAQQIELVEMDRSSLGADGDRDQVAIPGRELLQLGEQLLSLGAALGPLQALIGLARGQVETRDARLLELARLGAALRGVAQHRRRRFRGIELRRRVRTTRVLDQRVPPRDRRGIEQPLHPVEPAAGHACKRGALVLGEMRRACVDELANRLLRQPPERHELAARANRLGNRAEVVGDQDDHRVRRRLLEVLEQRVERVLVHEMRAEDEIDAAVRFERPHVQVASQLADRVDADHLAERVELVQVGMEVALRPEQRAREHERGLALADAGRAVEQVRVRRALAERRLEQARRLELLREARERAHGSPSRCRREGARRRRRRSARDGRRRACGSTRRHAA